MADQIPLKVTRTLGDTTALAEFQVGDTTAIVHGGTGADNSTDARSNLGAASSQDLTNHENDQSNSHNVTAAQAGAIPVAEKASINGVATLDAGGKIPVGQIPATALPEVFVVADAIARLALTVQEGDEAIQLDTGDHWIYDGAVWVIRPSPSVIFGSGFQIAEDLSVVTTNNSAFVTKVSMTTPSVVAGLYRLGVAHGFNTRRKKKSAEFQILQNSVLLDQTHRVSVSDEGGN